MLLWIATAALLGACGVPLDDAPRAIDRSTTSTSSPTTVASQPGEETQSIFFLEDERLVDVPITADDTPSINDALTAVLGAPPKPLKTRIPKGTELLGFELEDRTAVIDLSERINEIEAERQTEAYAQLVFTALASGRVDRVMFRVEGEPVQAPTDNGGLEVVGADDYDPPLSPR